MNTISVSTPSPERAAALREPIEPSPAVSTSSAISSARSKPIQIGNARLSGSPTARRRRGGPRQADRDGGPCQSDAVAYVGAVRRRYMHK
jgi:hypothetical protein